MTLEPIHTEHELDLATATLDELADAARRELSQTESHLVGALAHFIRYGEILLVARTLVPSGEWMRWCESIANSSGRTYEYKTSVAAMRLAHYKDHLPAEAFETWIDDAGRLLNPSPHRALSYVRGLPVINRKGVVGHGESTRDEARRLRKAGLPYDEIGPMVGVSSTAVRMWCEPGAEAEYNKRRRAREREQRAAQRALRKEHERQERDRLARATGGEIADAYSLIRRALTAIDRAGQAPDAIRHLHKAEEAIVEAMREQRGQA